MPNQTRDATAAAMPNRTRDATAAAMPNRTRDATAATTATSSPRRPRREREHAEPAIAQRSPPKRVRLEPRADGPPHRPPAPPAVARKLPPLHTLTTARAAADAGDRTREKLQQLRALYQADVTLVHRELQTALDVCRRPQAPLGAAVPADHLRRLKMSVETLQKLLRLLSARPAPRLRGPAHLALLCAVETQIRTQVLPVATVIRSFQRTSALLGSSAAPPTPARAGAAKSVLLSPRSPSAVLPVSACCSGAASSSRLSPPSGGALRAPRTAGKAPPDASWRHYLSMVLSLHL